MSYLSRGFQGVESDHIELFACVPQIVFGEFREAQQSEYMSHMSSIAL